MNTKKRNTTAKVEDTSITLAPTKQGSQHNEENPPVYNRFVDMLLSECPELTDNMKAIKFVSSLGDRTVRAEASESDLLDAAIACQDELATVRLQGYPVQNANDFVSEEARMAQQSASADRTLRRFADAKVMELEKKLAKVELHLLAECVGNFLLQQEVEHWRSVACASMTNAEQNSGDVVAKDDP